MIKDEYLDQIRSGKESISLEFKEASQDIPKNVYDTVCSFSNRNGGNIYLGVADDGMVTGVNPEKILQMKKDFVTAIQSPIKINPPLYLDINEFDLDEKKILHVFVPSSSQVHRHGSKIFDRNEDADIDITNNTVLVQQTYIRKQSEYTERQIYPFVNLEDLRGDLIDRVKKVAITQDANHIWATADHIEILKSLGMYSKDYINGREGFTLAAIITFGKDELIASVLPYFRIDALLRIEDVERYDDRENIRTNLIESYERLMGFVRKHLPSAFYIEGDVRINVRDVLFRELIVNMLVHREYSNAYVSRLIIEKDRILVENANKPVHPGIMQKNQIEPYPKNPTIAKVFNILGLIDELGSGVNKIFKYAPIMFGEIPLIENRDIFKVRVPKKQDNVGKTNDVSEELPVKVSLSENQKIVLESLNTAMSARELMEILNLSDISHFRRNILNPLLLEGLIVRTKPDKPKSSKQKFIKAIFR